MKLNPKHHSPKLAEQIDEYYENCYFEYPDYSDYDSCYFDEQWDDEIYHDYDSTSDFEWVEYNWLATSDRVIVTNEAQDNFDFIDGHKTLIYDNGDQEYEIYSYGGYSKIAAFFGLVLTVMKEMKTHSRRLISIHDKLVDRYPQIYIKLLDIIK